jgi:Zn-dependent peptidase ImmA (M78 family)
MPPQIEFLKISYIEDKANELLYKAQRLGFYDFNSPTPIDLIIEKILDLNIRFDNLDKDLKGVLGLIDFENKSIWLDNSLNDFETGVLLDKHRGNFTLGHEAGHFTLGHDKYAVNDNLVVFHNEELTITKLIEKQANMFSAMLLMPREVVIKKWNGDFAYILNITERITEMHLFFKVSREAMQYRLINLGLV